jgi:hypothetical protein
LLVHMQSSMSETLPCQIDFGFLSLPEFQQFSGSQDGEENDAFSRSGSSNISRSGSSNSQKAASQVQIQDAYVPVNYISPDASAFLIAAEITAARHAEAVDTGVLEFEVNGLGPERILDGFYDPERAVPNMPPPKKFFRTFWQSISHRLLNRRAPA